MNSKKSKDNKADQKSKKKDKEFDSELVDKILKEIKEKESAQFGEENKEKVDLSNEFKLDLTDPNSKIKDLEDKLIRNIAEFENFKKRTIKEKEESYDFAVCEASKNFVPILESIERAVESCSAIESSNEETGNNILSGLKMIQKQFVETLENMQIKQIEAVGQVFDPNLHNAVMHIDDENIGENIITKDFSKGYIYKDKYIIKHSMVEVAN